MFDETIFKNDLLKCLNDALIVCKKNSDKLIVENIKTPIFFPNGTYKKYKIDPIPDYEYFINHHLKSKIISSKTYSIVVKFFVTEEFKNLNKKLIGNTYDNFKVKPNFVKDLPLKFIAEYVRINDGFSENKTNFNKTFQAFLKFIKNILEEEYITPLFNFESDIDEKGIMLGNVGIRKINELEFSRFTNLDDNFNMSNVFFHLTHILFVKHTSDDLNSGFEIVKKQFQILLDSLSLYTEGSPQIGAIYRNIHSPWIYHDSRYDNDVIHQKHLKFFKKDKIKLKKIFNLFEGINFSIKGNKFVELSKRRFISALSRTDPVDQIVDLMICLESLYVEGGGEITVRFGSRVATLLSKNEKEREDCWIFAKKMYNLRSRIVHGEEIENTEINGIQYTYDELLERLVNIARKSVLIYLQLLPQYSGNKKIDQIADDLDKAVINRNFLKEFRTKFK
jgi:hypothetical protein